MPGSRSRRLSAATILSGLLLIHHEPGMAAGADAASADDLPTVIVTSAMPLPGLGLPLREVAANVQSIQGRAIEQQHSGNIAEFLEQNLGSVVINSAQGNYYQPDLSYRGFTASPLLGTPQGLSVFQDGVRINEPFGDVVNWDLLPQAAIADLQVMPGSNPVFGLNTLGGAIAITTKSGRTNPGGRVEMSGGSFGRKTLELEQGGSAGNLDYFLTANDSSDRGWADHNQSQVRQLFGKVGYQDRDTSLDLSLTAANNDLSGTQTIPRSFLGNRRQAYTFPDQNLNRAMLWSLSGSRFLGENLQLSANAYYRNYRSQNTSSNVNHGYADDGIEADNSRSLIDQGSHGFGLQLSYFGTLAGMENRMVVGVAGDFAGTRFRQANQAANFTPERNAIGVGDFVPGTDADTHNRSFGVFASDTLELGKRWAVTASGRYNRARVTIADQSGGQPKLNGEHAFSRFNPGLGLTFNPAPALTAYAAYSQGMRTPTAIELACADPGAPCSLPNSFISDPPLKPVIAKTTEIGVRGQQDAASQWRVTLFRTDLGDDIQFISSGGASSGIGYFQNVGASRRQGLELVAGTTIGKLGLSIGYSYIDATYQSVFAVHSPSNTTAGAGGDIQVRPGNRLPGVPENTAKLRIDYALQPNWRVAANLLYRSAIYARGDDNNQDGNGKISGYTVINLDTTYTVTRQLQVFARVDNLFNREYANFGTLGQNFFNGQGHSFDGNNVSNEQFVGVGAPRGVWVGLRYAWP